MRQHAYPYYLANRPQVPNEDLVVYDKYTLEPAARVAQADASVIEEAIGQASRVAPILRRMPAHQRQSVLQHCAGEIEGRFEELAEALCIEAGKPIRDSRGEVTRLLDTFRIAAEEATRWTGEVMPLDISPRAEGYRGMWKRIPVGPCAMITPFNFPLNLAAHKIAPALAVGCPFVLKPASLTPIGSLLLGEILSQTDLPEGAFSILPCSSDQAQGLVADPRIKLLSFTGSPKVGWALKEKAGRKRVSLELGGNAACIVDEGTDLDDAVSRITFGAFYQSGQSCISVQRILIHEKLYDELRARLVSAAQSLKMGNPRDEDTSIGPLILEDAAKRLEDWIREAVDGGAEVLCGGHRQGVMFEPTLLQSVDPRARISDCEAFGPVAVLSPFSNFEEALAIANDSEYGLQAGVFTRDIHKMHRAWDELEVGGVIIGDVPSWRVDHMPYGGVKGSGLGREGIRFAMEEMSEIRLLVVRDRPVC